MHRSKQPLYSLTSSAMARSLGGTTVRHFAPALPVAKVPFEGQTKTEINQTQTVTV